MTGDERPATDFDTLAGDLERLFGQGVNEPWPATEFEALAARVFAHQFEGCAAYRSLCERRGITPEALACWQDIPPVPAMAFKHLDLVSVAREPEAVFVTSGTTLGPDVRGRHLVPRLSLYRASLAEPFRAHVLTDAEPMPFVSLIPSAAELPNSSLSYMVTAAAELFASDVRWLVDGQGELDVDGLLAVADETAAESQPLLLLGTALALTRALEQLGTRPLGPLAEGSRIMETGGFKGLDVDVSRETLYARLVAATGVPVDRIVDEYGMTELLSQLYEPVLSEGPEAAGAHLPPPWLRLRALDPVSLDDVPEGQEGILAFFDLANLGSVSHVLTQDVGRILDGRVHLRGRVRGAEPRGCSRAMDELMIAARAGR